MGYGSLSSYARNVTAAAPAASLHDEDDPFTFEDGDGYVEVSDVRLRRPFGRRHVVGALCVAAVVGTVAVTGSRIGSSDPSATIGSRMGSLRELRFPQAPSSATPALSERVAAMSRSKVMYSVMEEAEKAALFSAFKVKHGRTYSDDAEEDGRFEAFKANLDEIDRLNLASPLALYGPTKFADLTSDERKSMRHSADFSALSAIKAGLPTHLLESAPLGRQGLAEQSAKANGRAEEQRGSQEEGEEGEEGRERRQLSSSWWQGQVSWISAGDCAACNRYPHFSLYNYSTMPTSFDWRRLGAVTPVKNQKYCGSCWSFSTAADIEGTSYLATGELTSRSEQQLVACDANKGYTEGCNGGYPYAAMDYIIKFGGMVSEASYPYKGICAWDSCRQDIYYGTPKCDKTTLNTELKSKAVAHIAGWQMVALGADYEPLMALAMLKNGPISISFNSEGMDFYVHGVSGCPTTEKGETVCEAGAIDVLLPCEPTYLDHAVLIVGYGVQDGVDYWVIKNSWGSDWGEDGYYRLVRGLNQCGVANMAVHSVVKPITKTLSTSSSFAR